MIQRTEIGGQGQRVKVAQQDTRRRGKIYTNTGRNDIPDIMNSINSIVGSVGKIQQQEAVKRDKEDMIRLTSKADVDLKDSDNALQGASYDDDLNEQVNTWRGQGQTDTEIMNGIKDYKMNKAVSDLGLDAGNESDEATNAYFNSYVEGMLGKIRPHAERDRKTMQKNIINTGSSYIRTSSDSVQDKMTNTTTLYKSYGMTEEQAMGVVIQSAFSQARRGDDSMLEGLKTAKDSQGNNIIDTVNGSKLYEEQLNLTQQDKAYKDKQNSLKLKASQVVTTTNLYTSLFDKNVEPTSVTENANVALREGKITMLQHKQLVEQIDDVMDVDGFAEVSNGQTYLDLRGRAELGLLPKDELLANKHRLSDKDFTAIGNLAIKQGGLDGTGSEQGKIVRTWIDNVSKTESGYDNVISGKIAGLTNAKLAGDRKTFLERQLMTEAIDFRADKGQEPNNAEMDVIKQKVVREMERLYPDPLGATTGEIPSIKGQTREDIDTELQGLTKEQQKAMMGTMSDAQLKIYMGG